MQKSETGDYSVHGFDPYMDFSQFLEEARIHHSSQVKSQPQLESPNLAEQKILMGEERKSKKSWKSSLFSWWKVNKKSKPQKGSNSTTPLHIPNTRRGSVGSVSGPIYYGCGGKSGFVQRPTSGPLTGTFTPSRRGEVGIPYVTLDQLNHPIGHQAYGPVYLVT